MFELLLLALAGVVGGVITAGVNNNMAQQREEQARAENYKYNEMAAQMSDQRTRALYTDLQSPEAITGSQMQAIEKYGLSKSLLYSGGVSGGGGVSQSPIGGTNGISPSIFGAPAPSAADIAQLQKTQAETRLINAQADTESGDNARGQNEILNIMAEINNRDAMTNYAKVQTELIELTKDSTIREATANATIAAYRAEQSFFEMQKAGVEFEVSQATKDARIELQKASVEEIISKRLKNESDIKLNDAQIKELAAKTAMLYDESMRGWAITDAMLQNADTFKTEIENVQKQFEEKMRLEWAKYGFDKDHWFANKMFDLGGDLVHAGGYILGLGMMKGGSKGKIGNLNNNGKGYFSYGKFDPKYNGYHDGVYYSNGLPQIPVIKM